MSARTVTGQAILNTAMDMWGTVLTITKLRDLARNIDPSASPIIMPRAAAELLVREGWTLNDFLLRFS